MDPIAHKTLINQILASTGDQAAQSDLLAQLADDYTVVTAQLIQASSKVSEQAKENDKLKETNLSLFMRIPAAGPAAAGKPDQKEPEQIDYSDFIDPATGELKKGK